MARAWLSQIERIMALVSSAKCLGYNVILLVTLETMLLGSNLGEVLTGAIDFND
jgi:hypothetical protein